MTAFHSPAPLLCSAAVSRSYSNTWIDRLTKQYAPPSDLGSSSDFFGSHAYYLTPRAAAHLLAATRPRCNRRKPDYKMRAACLGPAIVDCLALPTHAAPKCNATILTVEPRHRPPLRCFKPPRVLWRRELESFGIFVMNHREYQSYSKLLLQPAARAGDGSPTEAAAVDRAVEEGALARAAALRELQCKRMITTGYRPPRRR